MRLLVVTDSTRLFIGCKYKTQYRARWQRGPQLGIRQAATAYLDDGRKRNYEPPVCGGWVWHNWRGGVEGTKTSRAQLSTEALSRMNYFAVGVNVQNQVTSIHSNFDAAGY